jgi:hypothetical protein
MHYLATFNLHTLLWRPIRIESLTPAQYDIPLRMQVSEDNVMILVGMETSADQNTIIQTWHIPILTRSVLKQLCFKNYKLGDPFD